MQAKEPRIKKNKDALKYRRCQICGDVIADATGTVFQGKEGVINEKFAAVSNPILCKACAGEECPQNYKHEVKPLLGGYHYCTQCKKIIEKTSSYRMQVTGNDIKVDEAKVIYS